MIGERETGREIFGENDGRSGGDKRRDVAIVGGAHHAGNGCLPLVRKLQDALDGGVAVESHDDQPGLGEAGGGQDPVMRGVAVDNRVALSLCFLETGEVGLDGDVRYFRRLQRGRDKASHPSASAQQNVSVQRSTHCPDSTLGCGGAGARVPDQTLDEATVLDQEGCQPHGQCKGNEDRLTDCGRQQAAVYGQGHQQQAEFTAVGKDDGDAQRDGGGPAQHEPDDEADKALAEDKDQAPGEDRAGRNDDQSQVDRHAHRDEEQADEDVAERAQIVFDAMPEVAAADHHAGDERADRQGKAREMGEVSGAQRHEKRRQEEQVARMGSGSAR